jgi:hypothetical protein
VDEMNKLLSQIQAELKAPKGQFNSFGKYKYRSCEDIVEAVKPILAKLDCSLIISDEIVMIGDRFYIKATATIHYETDAVSASAYAREPLVKKGMDESQITGTASSYARKYALNGLLAIDDTKDADTMDNSIQRITKEQVLNIESLLEETGSDKAKFLKWLKADSIESIQSAAYDMVITTLEKKRAS